MNKGDKIGECVFISYAIPVIDKKGGKRSRATFKCICGNLFVSRIDQVKSGNTTSCGCYRLSKLRDALFINYKIGDTIKGVAYLGDIPSNGKFRMAKFQCPFCPNEFISWISGVKNGHANSCGCHKIKRLIETHTKHGMCASTEYMSWSHMKNRCTNTEYEDYDSYGGRGIAVCDRWLDFINFISDMGLKPTAKHTIERVNNEGNYEPSNCIWATKKEQNSNKRNTVFAVYMGVIKPLVYFIEKTGLNDKTVRARLKRGLTIEEALEHKVVNFLK